MKVAIVGCGGLGNVHASAYAKIAGVTVVGVYDTETANMLQMAERIGAKPYSSYEEMLEQSGCEAVSVTVPSYLHKEMTCKAAQAGKHVICEKPMALNLEDAAEMLRVCEQNSVHLYIGHVVRFFPEYVQMKEQVASQALGRIGVAHLKRIGGHPGHARNWYTYDSLSGGVVLDLMVHDLDFLRWSLGEVRSVYGVRKRKEDVDHALATLIFESGAVANVEAYWGYPGPFTTAADIAGSGGVIRSDSSKSGSLHIRKAASAGATGPFVEVPNSPVFNSPYELEIRHFLDCIQNNSKPVVTAHDAYKAMEIGLAVMESSQSGQAILLNHGVREGSK